MERTGNGQNIAELLLGQTSTIEINGGQLIAISDKANKINTVRIELGFTNEVWDGSDGNITTPGIINSSSINGAQTPLPVDLASFYGEMNDTAINCLDYTFRIKHRLFFCSAFRRWRFI